MATNLNNLFFRIAFVIAILFTAVANPVNANAAPAMDEKLAWHFDESYGGFVLDDPQDGTTDVAIDTDIAADDPVLGRILRNVRAGDPAKWTTTVPGLIIHCVGDIYVNGVLVASETNCDGPNVEVEAGVIEVKNSTGPIGGFRWTITSGGWHDEDSAQTCPPLDGHEKCWDKTNGLAWTGATDGSADIHQAADLNALQMIRDGASVTFEYGVAGQLVGTCHALVEKLGVNGEVLASFERHDCGEIETAVKFPAGKYRISESTTEQGGWRVSPWFGFGWRAEERMPANYKFVELIPGADYETVNDNATVLREEVTGKLISVDGNKATFEVSAGGEYVLLQEDNIRSEQVKETANNGRVTFTMKDNNNAMRLQNIVADSAVDGWSVCENAREWLCKEQDEDASMVTPPAPESLSTPESDDELPRLMKVDGNEVTIKFAVAGKYLFNTSGYDAPQIVEVGLDHFGTFEIADDAYWMYVNGMSLNSSVTGWNACGEEFPGWLCYDGEETPASNENGGSANDWLPGLLTVLGVIALFLLGLGIRWLYRRVRRPGTPAATVTIADFEPKSANVNTGMNVVFTGTGFTNSTPVKIGALEPVRNASDGGTKLTVHVPSSVVDHAGTVVIKVNGVDHNLVITDVPMLDPLDAPTVATDIRDNTSLDLTQARAVARRFRTVRDLKAATEAQLRSIAGIGHVKAGQVMTYAASL